MTPQVTVIVPATHDRKQFNDEILSNFIKQDYKQKDLIFNYDDGTIGSKLNKLCKIARGNIILRMDSDDKYANDWISRSVKSLIESEADITGLSNLLFYDAAGRKAYEYTYNLQWPWIAGATMCFYKSVWERNKFKEDVKQGEDAFFTWSAEPPLKVFAHDYKEGFLASIHQGNTSRRAVESVDYRRCSEEEEEGIRRRFFGA